jgi:membrane protease YdiL (CAAX protease family)
MYQFEKPPDPPYISEEDRRSLQSPSTLAVFWADFSSDLRTNLYASAYIVVMLLVAALGNYYGFKNLAVNLIFWTALYLPALIFPRFAGWKLTQLGFSLNLRLLLVSAILLAIVWFPLRDSLVNFRADQLPGILIQTYARSGEELFFRGFIFLYALQIFRSQKWPVLWAVILSTLCFTWVHTQTLLPGAQTEINGVILFALVMGLLRAWTISILPGVIAHLVLNGASSGILPVVLVYAIFAFWAGKREAALASPNGNST